MSMPDTEPASAKLREALGHMAQGKTISEAAKAAELKPQTVEKGWLRWIVLPEWRAMKGIVTQKPISVAKQAAFVASGDELIARAVIAIRAEIREEYAAELIRLHEEIERLKRAQPIAPLNLKGRPCENTSNG